MKKTFKITDKDAGRRLDSFLAAATLKSRTLWQKYITAGRVKVNRSDVAASHKLETGDQVSFSVSEETQTTGVPMPRLQILFENDEIVVINKPAGILVHSVPGGGQEPTVAAFAAGKSSDTDSERPGIVHRLDRNTSGVMIIAKTLEAKAFLQRQFKDRLVQKEYIVLLEGHLKQPEAVIALPIGRKSDSARYSVSAQGKEAETAYKVLAEYTGYSLVSVSPKTGRTHQIRVHFSHLGHPVAGDELYGAKKLAGLDRTFLHATKLTIAVPPSGKVQSFTAPIPAELQQIIDDLYAQVY